MQVFFTYAHDNLKEVQQLVEVLSSGGHLAWFDHQLLPGQDWKEELAKSISACEVYAYALTKASVISEWCQWEFGTPVNYQKPAIPVLLEADVLIPDALQSVQFADLTQGYTPFAVAKLMGPLLPFKRSRYIIHPLFLQIQKMSPQGLGKMFTI